MSPSHCATCKAGVTLHHTAATSAQTKGPFPRAQHTRLPGQCAFGQAAASPHLARIWVPWAPGWGWGADSPAYHFPSHRPPSGSIRLRAAGCDPGATEGDGMRLGCSHPGWGPCRTPGSRNQRSSNWIWRLRVEGCDRVAATCKFSTRRLSLPQERAGLGWGVCAVGLGARRWGARREAKTCSGQRPGHRACVGVRAAASEDEEVVGPAAGGALQPCRPWALAPGQSGSG